MPESFGDCLAGWLAGSSFALFCAVSLSACVRLGFFFQEDSFFVCLALSPPPPLLQPLVPLMLMFDTLCWQRWLFESRKNIRHLVEADGRAIRYKNTILYILLACFLVGLVASISRGNKTELIPVTPI